jgi:hypothetical protein
MALQPRGPWPLFSFMIILQTVGLLGRDISSSQGLYLNTGQHKHRINIYTHKTSMPCVGFEPTISVSVRAKTVHALDRSTTVTGKNTLLITVLQLLYEYHHQQQSGGGVSLVDPYGFIRPVTSSHIFPSSSIHRACNFAIVSEVCFFSFC